MTVPTASVVGPGWVDHSVNEIAGLFPLSVERSFNAAVALHAPGVTTVTVGARYYALHSLVAQEKLRLDLTDEQARALLRRAEVVLALASRFHRLAGNGHPVDAVAPHGNDYLGVQIAAGDVELDVASALGAGTYAKASWGYWGPYRGSEMTLTTMDVRGFIPGKAYNDDRVRPALQAILDLAQPGAVFGASDFVGTEDLCLCRTASGSDGEWLAERFAGDINASGLGGVLGQTMRMLATAISTGNITDDDDVARFVRYNPQLIEHPRLRDHEIRLRWRGLAFRAQSVHAWRQLWADLCGQLPTKGAASRQELRAWLADIAPPTSVREFLTSLPSTVDSNGAPVDAEGHPTVQGLAVPLRRLAVILLGAQRYTQLPPTELLGFAGPPGSVDHVEELSPHWANHQLTAWADRSMSDFCAPIVDVLIARSQRIALRKSTYNLKTGRFTIPARVRVQGDHLFQIFPETANKPGLRWAQLMSMGRQTDLFTRADGNWHLGPRGDLIA